MPVAVRRAERRRRETRAPAARCSRPATVAAPSCRIAVASVCRPVDGWRIVARPRPRRRQRAMAIDFTLTKEQQELQAIARSSPRRSSLRGADGRRGARSAARLPAHEAGLRRGLQGGIAFSHASQGVRRRRADQRRLDHRGGGDLRGRSRLRLHACSSTGSACMPVWYYGTEEQKERFLRRRDVRSRATSSSSATPRASRPARRAAPPTSTRRAVGGAGIGVTATPRRRRVRDQRPQVLAVQRRRLGQQGREPNLVVVRTDPDKGGTEGLSAIIVERGTPGVSYKLISTLGQRLDAELRRSSSTTPACRRRT